MWSRADLKANARQRLTRYHWYGVLVCFLASLLGVSSTGVSVSGDSKDVSQTWKNITHQMSPSELTLFFTILTVVSLVTLIIVILFTTLVANPTEIGFRRYFIAAREVQTPVSELFSGFRMNYSNAVLTMFMRQLYIFLWSLLLFIPGIIKGYSYRMVPYLLAENPDMDYRRALQLSTDMMDGHKMELFLLELSFIGWNILSGLTMGILGILYVNPYFAATEAEFYVALRYQAFACNMTSPAELPFVFT